MSKLTVETIRDIAGLEKLKTCWDELLATSEADPVFGSYEWTRIWWQSHSADNVDPFLLVFTLNKTVKGIIGLYHTRAQQGPFTVHTIKSLGVPAADYYNFIIADEFKVEIINQFVENQITQGDFDAIALRHIKSSSGNLAELVRISKKNGLIAVIEQTEPCPYIRLEKTFEDYRQKQLNSRSRNMYSRKYKKLLALGEIRFEMVTDKAAIIKVLPEMAALEDKSWKGPRQVGIFASPEKRDFYFKVTEALAEKEQVALHLLWHNARLLCYYFCFLLDDRLYFYNTAFDPEYSRFSPGSLSFLDLIKCCHERRIIIIDMLRGGHDYKSGWAAQCTENINLHLFPPTIKGRILALLFELRLNLRKLKRKFIGKKHEN
ncbi:MAG: GNAT family N-acetyltransferase [Proteobacteria bacterium]|nr:GNAT family N-acetyltransferase [Pseudomonadota bacterium]MBU1710323.1 GNAT family N-acetyltransferase [Pseudomonadota bacterium]